MCFQIWHCDVTGQQPTVVFSFCKKKRKPRSKSITTEEEKMSKQVTLPISRRFRVLFFVTQTADQVPREKEIPYFQKSQFGIMNHTLSLIHTSNRTFFLITPRGENRVSNFFLFRRGENKDTYRIISQKFFLFKKYDHACYFWRRRENLHNSQHKRKMQKSKKRSDRHDLFLFLLMLW